MNRVGYSIRLFILIVIVFNLPISLHSDKKQTKDNEPSLLTPTYLAEQLSSQRFNEDGLLSHEINASRWNTMLNLDLWCLPNLAILFFGRQQ